MTDARMPGGPARTGPWIVRSRGAGASARSWVTASCTGCGAAPWDEDLGMHAGFGSVKQAREELPRAWGWRLTARSAWAGDDELLCPACATAAADDAGNPLPSGPDPDGGQELELPPWWEDPAQPRPALPPNAAAFPAAPVTREG